MGRSRDRRDEGETGRSGDVVARARGLRRSFRGGDGAPVPAVRDASFELREGEVVLVLGPSGSGKTTLLSMVGGLIEPDAGLLEVCGTDLRALDEGARPAFRLRHVGFVFQTFRLLDALSAGENVELPLHLAGHTREASWSRSRELLAELGVEERSDARPDTLSAGERQRVAVARALALDPPLLLADEPTGSLDARAGSVVTDLLCRAARSRGAALLIVSHDERLLGRADTVLTMTDGVLRPYDEGGADGDEDRGGDGDDGAGGRAAGPAGHEVLPTRDR